MKVKYVRRPRENFADHLALHSDAPAVDDPNGLKTEPVSFFKIGFDRSLRIAGSERMKIEDIGYRNFDRALVVLHAARSVRNLGAEAAIVGLRRWTAFLA